LRQLREDLIECNSAAITTILIELSYLSPQFAPGKLTNVAAKMFKTTISMSVTTKQQYYTSRIRQRVNHNGHWNGYATGLCRDTPYLSRLVNPAYAPVRPGCFSLVVEI
jgi:hypothetical protein